MPAQTSKDIANVVGRLDAGFKLAIPVLQYLLRHEDADVEQVIKGDGETLRFHGEEMFIGGDARRRPIEVGSFPSRINVRRRSLAMSGGDLGESYSPALITMALPKSALPSVAARSKASSVALSSWLVMQDLALPPVHTEAVSSKALLS